MTASSAQAQAALALQLMATLCLLVDVFSVNAGVRSIAFAADGSCLLAATQDSLTSWAWEPIRRLDAVDVPWAKVLSSPVIANMIALGA